MKYWILLINICLLSACEIERLLPVEKEKPPFIKTYSVTSFNTFRTGIITYNNQLVLLGDGHNSTTKTHITFTRVDINGEIVSSKFFEGQMETAGNSIIETSAGDFIIVGQYGTPGSNSKQKLYVLKVDALGKVLWEKVFSGQPSFSAGNQQTIVHIGSHATAASLKSGKTSFPALSDISDEYMILARTNSEAQDVYLLKINTHGDSLWSKSYPTLNREVGNTIIQTTDGGFALLGNIKSAPNDLFLMKLNSQGDYQWSNNYDIYIYDEGYALKESSQGGFYLFGLSNRIENQTTGYTYPSLVKVDAMGNKEWEKIYKLDKEKKWGTSISKSSDENYYLSVAGPHDSYVLKINPSGNVFWQKHFSDLTTYCVAEDANGQVVMMGDTWKYGRTNLKLFVAHIQ